MSKKVVEYEVGGIFGALLAIPIILLTYAWLFAVFVVIGLIILSPLILMVLLLWAIAS